MGQEGLRLHEKQRGARHPDVGHAVAHVAAPRIRKGRASRAHAHSNGIQELHPELGSHRPAQRNLQPSAAIRIAGSVTELSQDRRHAIRLETKSYKGLPATLAKYCLPRDWQESGRSGYPRVI